MTNLKLISERVLSLAELKESLAGVKKEKKELNFTSTKTLEYLNTFSPLKLKEAEELKSKLTELNIPRLKEKNMIKVVDLLPGDVDALKIIFTGEDITIKQDDLKRIIDLVKEYT